MLDILTQIVSSLQRFAVLIIPFTISVQVICICVVICRAVLVDGPSFPLLCVARTDLGMPMDAILVTIQGSER